MNERKSSLLERVKNERDDFSRYRRDHPHFKRNIFIDALISSVLVIIGFGFVNQITEQSRIDELLRSGAVAMTSNELIKHVKDEKITAYWLGPKQGYKYSIICKDRSEIIVTYLPQGVSVNHPDRFNLTVETYSKILTREQPARSNISTDRDDFVASDGTVGSMDSSRPQIAHFSIPETGKVVEVQYPSTKRIYDVYTDGEELRLISEPKP